MSLLHAPSPPSLLECRRRSPPDPPFHSCCHRHHHHLYRHLHRHLRCCCCCSCRLSDTAATRHAPGRAPPCIFYTTCCVSSNPMPRFQVPASRPTP
ncbi:hypothetical protein BD309DRAFT_967267 [Dichomitus squalens]|nr:hypothetical protein BD309DRAFT_967267 [Dichomitus squalens]